VVESSFLLGDVTAVKST